MTYAPNTFLYLDLFEKETKKNNKKTIYRLHCAETTTAQSNTQIVWKTGVLGRGTGLSRRRGNYFYRTSARRDFSVNAVVAPPSPTINVYPFENDSCPRRLCIRLIVWKRERAQFSIVNHHQHHRHFDRPVGCVL